MIDWRIYYADGTTFDSAQGTWNDAPCDGVIAVKRPKDHLHKGEFYMMPPGHDTPIMTDDLGPQLRALRWVKFGLWVPDAQYHEIMGRVIHDERD